MFHLKKYVSKRKLWQLFFIFIFNFITLWLFYWAGKTDIIWAIGVSSLAASSCIVFGKPRLKAAHPLSLILTYTVAIICGVCFHYIALLFPPHWLNFFSVLAVCITFLILSWKHLTHPPALGMAMLLVLELNDYITPALVLLCVALLVLFRDLFLKIVSRA